MAADFDVLRGADGPALSESHDRQAQRARLQKLGDLPVVGADGLCRDFGGAHRVTGVAGLLATLAVMLPAQ